MDLGALRGGAVVTEKVSSGPGMGALCVGAVLARDGPVVMGVVLVPHPRVHGRPAHTDGAAARQVPITLDESQLEGCDVA